MAGEIEGRGIVDRQRPRLLIRETLAQRLDHSRQEIARHSAVPAIVYHFLKCPPEEKLPALSCPPLRRHRELRKAQQRQHPRLGKALDRRRDMGHRRFRNQPWVAAEQGQGDHHHSRPRGLGRHVALAALVPAGHRFARRLHEHRPLCLYRRRREAGGDDFSLLTPQAAVRGQQSAADNRSKQMLDDVRLGVIGSIVEQHMLDQLGIEQDVDAEAEDMAFEIVDLERPFGPAVDRSPGALAEKAAPGRDRFRRARGIRRHESLGHFGGLTLPPIAPPPRQGRPKRGGLRPARSWSRHRGGASAPWLRHCG